jgi:hypothetical protein
VEQAKKIITQFGVHNAIDAPNNFLNITMATKTKSPKKYEWKGKLVAKCTAQGRTKKKLRGD